MVVIGCIPFITTGLALLGVVAEPAVSARADASSHDQHDDDDDHSADQQWNGSATDAGAHGPALPLRPRT